MRPRSRFIRLTIFGVVLIAGGVLGVLLSSTRESRVFAIAVLAFGIAVGAAAMMLAPRRETPPLRTTTVDVDGRVAPAVEIAVARGRLVAAVFGTGGFAIGGAALAAVGAVVIGLLGAVVFGVMTVLGALNVMAGSTYLLTERGIVSRSGLGEVEIGWDDVAAISDRRTSGARQAVVTAIEPPVVRNSHGLRLINRLTRRWFGDLSIPLDLVDTYPELLLTEIVRLSEEPAARADVASGALARRLAPDANLTAASYR